MATGWPTTARLFRGPADRGLAPAVLVPSQADAWDTVTTFEPASQYGWMEVRAEVAGTQVPANVLCGKKLGKGTSSEPVKRWSASNDPVFTEGLAEVRRLVLEAAPLGVDPRPDDPRLLNITPAPSGIPTPLEFIERYTALRFGPNLDPMERTKSWGTIRRSEMPWYEPFSHQVVDARDPDKTRRMAADGTGASDCYYQVRSNLSHRGKGTVEGRSPRIQGGGRASRPRWPTCSQSNSASSNPAR